MAGHHSTKISRKFSENFPNVSCLPAWGAVPFCHARCQRRGALATSLTKGGRYANVTAIIGTVLLVFIMLLGLGPSTFAASDTRDTDDTSRLKDTLRLENVTIPWSFPLNGATCEAIPAAVGSINPVDNSSDRVREITREVLADGSQVIVQDDLIKGLASDTMTISITSSIKTALSSKCHRICPPSFASE